jgi:dephospho-CoA kinase
MRRMSAQLPEQEKIKRADYLIDNSGSFDATERQVRAVWKKLSDEAIEKARSGPADRNRELRTEN